MYQKVRFDMKNNMHLEEFTNSQTPKVSKTRQNPFKLINCEKYNGIDGEAPFQVQLSVEVLAIVDVHAHCVQTEVIGLLGGRFCSNFRQLNILSAEPCRSITASTTDLQCEMDPVSQAEASERIVNAGYFVVGWYHSHPTFVPNPSLRDLETQEKYQEMFKEGTNSPFIALIISPYSGPINPQHKKSLVSKFKCLMVGDDNSQVEYKVPFEFDPVIVRKERLLVNVLNKTRHLCSYLEGRKTSHCMIDRIRGREITLVNKLSASVKHHLEVAGLSSKEADLIVDTIKDLISDHLNTHYSVTNSKSKRNGNSSDFAAGDSDD